jgi:hypothetical protein
MNTPVSCDPSVSRFLAAPAKWRWREVQRGLEFILAGYLALCTLAVPGAVLGLAARGALPKLAWWLKLGDNDGAEFFGPVAGLLGVLLACALGLLGQGWCLGYALRGRRARTVLLLAILATALTPLMSLAALFFGADWDLQVAERLQDALQERHAPPLGSLFQLTSLALALLSVLLLSLFARGVTAHLRDPRRVSLADRFFLYVALLLGVSAGAFLAFRHVPGQAYLLLALGACWALGLAWHVWLIVGASRCIRAAVTEPGADGLPAGVRQDSGSRRTPYSVRRVVPTSPN